ncbi:hypothetical protein F5Y03DRAFT_349981 [Xylaria venustula]|nr:hypothetical protein F5Y03DRAFT_349981 [Xylaria venustula]
MENHARSQPPTYNDSSTEWDPEDREVTVLIPVQGFLSVVIDGDLACSCGLKTSCCKEYGRMVLKAIRN